jgi:Family of unknown function (DUF5677)
MRQWTDEELRMRGYLARVEDHIMARPPSGQVFEASPLLGDALSLYARCRSLFAAIRLLIDQGYPEESMILGRSLVESSLRLEYLAMQPPLVRESLLIQRRVAGLQQFEFLSREHRSHLAVDPGPDPKEVEMLKRQRAQLLSRRTRLGIAKLQRFPSDKDLARELGHLDEYVDYLFAHEITHGSVLSQATRSRSPAPDTLHIYARTGDPDVLVGGGSFAARTALRALQACEVIFAWPTDGTRELLAENEAST